MEKRKICLVPEVEHKFRDRPGCNLVTTLTELYWLFPVAEFEVLTAVTVKNAIFWDVTLCIPGDVHRQFEERNASIFRIEELVEQVTSNKLAAKESKVR
jgi:hypothetical protein